MFCQLSRFSLVYFSGFILPLLIFHKTRFSALFMAIVSMIFIKNLNKKNFIEFIEESRTEIKLLSLFFLLFFTSLLSFDFGSISIYRKEFLILFNKLFLTFLISVIFFVSTRNLITERSFAENFLRFLFIGFIVAFPIVFIDYKSSFAIQKLFLSKKIGYYRLNTGVDCYALLSIFFSLFFIKNKRYFLSFISISFGFIVASFGIIFQHTSHTAFKILCIALFSFLIQKILSKKNLYKFIKISLFLMFLFPIFIYFLNFEMIEKLEKFLKLSFLHRICIWHNAAIFIKEKSNIFQLFFGHGISSYKFITEKYEQISCTIYSLKLFKPYESIFAFALHPHNFSIEALFETGIFGSVILYFIFLRFFKSTIDFYPVANSLIFILFSSHSIWSSWFIYFSIFLIFLIKLSKISRDFTIKY